MTAMTLEGHSGTSVAIDVCGGCQAFWFDPRESLQLAPAAILRLFGLIGEHAASRGAALPAVLRCPRCAARLLPTHDRQRNTPFRYWRCARGHGRFITFVEFLREKDFIRPLTAAQIGELRQHLQVVQCSNCGAPIDLAGGASCTHCGSVVAMLDMQQAGTLVAQLRRAAEPRTVDPALPLELARARREVDAAFAAAGATPEWWREASSSGLVAAGVGAFTRWLKKSGLA